MGWDDRRDSSHRPDAPDHQRPDHEVHPRTNAPLNAYIGGGIGVYFWDIRGGPPVRRTTAGLHGVAGIEVLLSGSRHVVRTDSELHALGPAEPHTLSRYQAFAATSTVGFGRRF